MSIEKWLRQSREGDNLCFPLLAVLMVWFAVSVVGCARPERYTYAAIKKDYAPACDVAERYGGKETAVPDGSSADDAGGLSGGSSSDPKQDACILERPITLADAIKIAQGNNPDNKMAAARILQAEADRRKANALFWPYIGVYTEYLQGDSPSAYIFKTVDQRELSFAQDLNYPGYFGNFESGVQARLNLFNGGRDYLTREMAETGLEIQQVDGLVVENSLAASVIRSYYDCLAAEDYIGIAEDSVATVTEQLRIMTVRYEGGGALKSDILSLKVRLAKAREDLVQSVNQLKIAQAMLANTLGISPDQEIRLVRGEDVDFSVPGDVKTGTLEAMKRRPELSKVRKQLSQSRMALDFAQSGYLPRIDFQGKMYVDDHEMAYDLDDGNWTAVILFNWDLFTGFSTRSEKDRAAAAIQELLAADRKALLNIKLDVKTAYLNMEAAKARLTVAESSVEMAEESLKLVKNQFEGGSATITRYLEAELDRNRARMRSTAAFYDREKATAEIGRAIGLFAKKSDR